MAIEKACQKIEISKSEELDVIREQTCYHAKMLEKEGSVSIAVHLFALVLPLHVAYNLPSFKSHINKLDLIDLGWAETFL